MSENSSITKVGIEGFGIFKPKYLKARRITVAKQPRMKKGVKLSQLSINDKKIVDVPARMTLSFKPSKTKTS